MSEMQSDWLPFARWNLLRNPFGQLSLADRMAAAVVDVECWLDKLRDKRSAVQFMGDCGRGKSTHLLALLSRFPNGKYVYLPQDGPRPSIPHGMPLFIDEAQRLNWWTRRRIFRRSVPLVLGTHADLSPALRRAGYQVETVCVASRTSVHRVHKLICRRLELARLGPGPIPDFSLEEANLLLERFGDDLRAMEDYLYQKLQDALLEETHQWPNVI